MSKIEFTPDQFRAVTIADRSLLVSAAAGSGKTAVLSARCVYLVCDAPPAERCDVDQLLVLTFTTAAAEQMRARIGSAMRKRAEQSDEPRIRKQLALLDRAQISTIHGLCSGILRQHFHAAGIDPAFRTLDGDESTLLRKRVAKELIEKQFDTDVPGAFHRLIEEYAAGQEANLIDNLLRTDDHRASMLEPDVWTSAAIARLREATDKPLTESELGKEFVRVLDGEIAVALALSDQVRRRVQHVPGAEKYAAHMEEVHQIIFAAAGMLKEGKLDRLRETMSKLKLPTLPTIRNPEPDVAAAKTDVNRAKETIKSLAANALFRFTPADWQANVGKTVWAAEAFFCLVELVRKGYQKAKDDLHALDFNDLERYALNLLRVPGSSLAPSAVAFELHERFQYVLVDEYQDTNEVQDALLHLLSRESLGSDCPRPNLFCVGDVKQSIYRFRHAEPMRFLKRAGKFRDPGQQHGVTIDLQQNFRSRPPLLRILNGIFTLLMQRDAGDVDYDATQRLNSEKVFPAHPDGFTGESIELHLLEENAITDNDESPPNKLDATQREAAVIAARIRQLVGADGSKPRQVADETDGTFVTRDATYKDIVVLLRSMKIKAERVSGTLRNAGIPVDTQSTTGFFGAVEIRDMLALMRLLDNRRQDVPLAAYLRSPLANLPRPEDSLALVRLQYPARDETIAFHQAVDRYAAEQKNDLADDLRRALAQVDEWRSASRARPVAEVIWTIFQQTDYLAYVSGLVDGPQREANLLALHDRARQFGTFQRQGLARFLEFLENLQDESDAGQPNIVAAADNAVRVMSVHKAKGQEFPIVIVADLGKQHNLQDARAQLVFEKSTGVAFDVVDAHREIRYTSLSKLVASERVKKSALSEELRVLYVALTRAKEHLILVGTAPAGVEQTWADDWMGHTGKIPAPRVLAGKSMLDWLGMASAILNQKWPGVIEYRSYDSDKQKDVAALVSSHGGRSVVPSRLREMKPLTAEPIHDAAAKKVIERVSFIYSQKELARIPAAATVSELTKAGRIAPSGWTNAEPAVIKLDDVLRPPKAAAMERLSTAAEAGSITHAFLQFVDFSKPCNTADLTAQLAALVARRVMSESDARQVDLAAICWLTETPIGLAIRENAGALLREFEVVFPRPTDPNDPALRTSDPADQVMVRGRIDLVVPTVEGLIVLDYKTDRVTLDTVDARADFYRPQIEAYRDALQRIVRRPVIAVSLVFLTARLLRAM